MLQASRLAGQQSRRILILALPMVLSNITTPLLGMVDTAVMGHMGAVSLMAGASIGALVISQLYWLCGFIRMAITGISAQAFGAKSELQQSKSFYQSAIVGLCIGLVALVLAPLVISLGFWFAAPHPDIHPFVAEYINVRLWGAPLALLNFTITGWLIGQQKMRLVLILTVIANLINGCLDVIFVYGLDMGITGLALASVIAELFITATGIYLVITKYLSVTPRLTWFALTALAPLLQLNRAIFLRNLCLQCTLAFITFQGARLGQDIVAVNAILMQFFVLTALGLDGVAQATEALVGESKGQKNLSELMMNVKYGILWSSIVAVAYALVFVIFQQPIINLMTNLPSVLLTTKDYTWVIALLPLIGHWCFVFDGIFVALTRGLAMQNSMLISSALFFFPTWWWLAQYGNNALWSALLAFLLARGVTLAVYFVHLVRTDKVLE